MAKRLLICTFDRVAEVYTEPRLVRNAADAIRGLQDYIVKDEHMKAHADDYTLFELGYFDDESASYQLHSKPQLLLKCGSLLDKSGPVVKGPIAL